MLNDVQTRIVNELNENYKLYLEMAKDSPYYDDLQKTYDKYSKIAAKWYNDLLDEGIARVGYDKALKSHKVDPYIAGGLGQGIGGIGGGLYAAISTAENNARIDEYRAHYKNEVFNASSARSASEASLLEVMGVLDSILDSIPDIKKYREEYRKNVRNRPQKQKETTAMPAGAWIGIGIAILIAIMFQFL